MAATKKSKQPVSARDTDLAPTERAILDRFKWRKITAPKPWQPQPGKKLIGYYAGRTVKNGNYGQHDVILIAVPEVGMRTVTGSQIIQLIDAAMIEIGTAVNITFDGYRTFGPSDKQKTCKMFSLEVSEGDPIPASEMPSFANNDSDNIPEPL